MILLTCISGLILIYYVYLILQFKRHIAHRPAVSKGIASQQKVSILIPFRNEEEVLGETLSSLSKVEYPSENFEIIFVNDHSTDQFLTVFEEYSSIKNIRVIDNKGEGKKSAIISGIDAAKFSWILTSDADCYYEPKWLYTCEQLINNFQADMYVLPVVVMNENSILSEFQYFESISTIGVNAGNYFKKGGVLLASGANLLYKKETFQKVQPFAQNLNVASGDDMFLLEKFKNENLKIMLSLEANAWVKTHSESTWKAVMVQRIRWAKKMHHFKFNSAFYYGALMLVIQLVLWLLLISSSINFQLFPIFIIALFIKSIADFQLLKEVSKIKKWKISWSSILVHEFLYMLALPLIMVLAMFKTPRWKERKIRS